MGEPVSPTRGRRRSSDRFDGEHASGDAYEGEGMIDASLFALLLGGGAALAVAATVV